MTDAPIQIRKPSATRVVRKLAARTGMPITETVERLATEALRRLDRVDDETFKRRMAAMDELRRRARALPIIGPKLTDADIYDEEGLPK